MADLTVDIVTPERVLFSGSAQEVRAPGWQGEFGVLPGHVPFLVLLRGGVTTVATSSGVKRFITGRGFVEAGPDRVTILTDSADRGENIDRAAAQRAIAEAERVLADTAAESEERLKAEQAIELARARLEF